MTLLNRPNNGHVASMVAVWRTLRALGPMPRERLVRLCSSGNGDSGVLSATISTWSGMGMFVEQGGIAVSAHFSDIGLDDTEALRTAVFNLLLQAKNCPSLWDEPLASDFVRVATWCMAQDPYAGSEWDEASVLKLAARQGIERLWGGDGRWQAFREWAYFCGIAIPTVKGFVLNPARAVRASIQGRSRDGLLSKVLTLPEFIAAIAEDVPIVEGGRYRKLIDERIDRDSVFANARRVSPCTSLALLQLDHEGEIVLLDQAGDVAVKYALVGQGDRVVRQVSHVRAGSPRPKSAVETGS
jgi:hypothetical protein